MHLSVANPLVGLKDPLRQHIFKELYSKYRKITVHVLYISYNIYGRDIKLLAEKKTKSTFKSITLEKAQQGL